MLETGKIIRPTKERVEVFLNFLETTPVVEACTLALTPGSSVDSNGPITHQQAQWLDEIRSLAAVRIASSETGAVIFWSELFKILIIPPFPLKKALRSDKLDASPLRQLMAQKYTIGVVLLRLGRYSVGVFEGDQLVTSKGDSRYVKGRHRAGGTSQLRFQRIREKQMSNLFKKTGEVVADQFAPYERKLDYILLGGERHTIANFLKECAYLRSMKTLTLKRVLAINEPKRSELERMPREIWKSSVCLFQYPEGFPC